MDNFLQDNYIVESILATGVLYVVYLLALRNRPTLIFNRIFLLAISLLGVLVPTLEFSLPQNSALPTSSILLEGVTISLASNEIETVDIFNWKTIYFAVTAVFLLHFVIQLIHIIRLGKENNGEQYKLITGKYPHFSFFNTIFINSELIQNNTEIETILEHEKVHVKQFHSIDIVLFELVKIIFWFNPFLWLIKNLVVENHEYLADKGMLKKTSINTYDYFNELLQSTLFTYKISIVNNFNHSLLKKRIKMMTKQNLKSIERFIPVLIVPVFFFVAIFFACSDNNSTNEVTNDDVEENNPQKEVAVTETEVKEKLEISKEGNYYEGSEEKYGEKVYTIVDEMPKFEGESFENFRKHIQLNLTYPQEAVTNEIQGKVFVQFVVASNGEVKNAEVVRGVDKLLDEEALRIVKESPKWTPGSYKGENVAVSFTFPISFVLK